MVLVALVPFLCWLLLFVIVYQYIKNEGAFTRFRIALLTATVIHGLLLSVLTECLSIFSLISFGPVLLSWLVVLLLLFGYCLYKRVRPSLVVQPIYSSIKSAIRMSWMSWAVVFVLLISLLIALVYPPNNYDSMTYHMARVAYWIENHSIRYYATHELRQLSYQPFAEWVILHLQVLTGGDVLANAVQWFYFVACLSTISLLTKALGGSALQQLTSVFVGCLVPMALIQSNTTQNDIVVAFFILSFGWLVMRLVQHISLGLLVMAGLSLGLALLTKGTAYLYGAGLCLWLLIPLLKGMRKSFLVGVKRGALLALIPVLALAMNAGYYYRNVELNGALLGQANKYTGNEGHSPAALTIVAVKNLMNHLPVNPKAKVILTRTAAAMQVDVDDPRYNMVPLVWMYEGIYFHEDYMQNFVHTLLLLLLAIFFLCRRATYRIPLNHYSLYFFITTLIGLLFCLLLKWQPWANRLQTALFLLYAPFIAIELSKFSRWFQWTSLVAMLVFAQGALFTSRNHPFPFSRRIYTKPFREVPLYGALKECKKYLSTTSYRRLGLMIPGDAWDYPYHVYLGRNGDKRRSIWPVGVTNESAQYTDHSYIPEAILSIDTASSSVDIEGRNYVRTRVFTGGPALFELK